MSKYGGVDTQLHNTFSSASNSNLLQPINSNNGANQIISKPMSGGVRLNTLLTDARGGRGGRGGMRRLSRMSSLAGGRRKKTKGTKRRRRGNKRRRHTRKH